MTIHRGPYYDESGFFFSEIDVSGGDHVFSALPRAIFVGGTMGDLSVEDQAGQVVTFKDVGNQTLPIRPARILSAGTTLLNIIAIW